MIELVQDTIAIRWTDGLKKILIETFEKTFKWCVRVIVLNFDTDFDIFCLLIKASDLIEEEGRS